MSKLNELGNQTTEANSVTPLRCCLGATVSGLFSSGMFRLTHSIVDTFASKPVISHNIITLKISVAVRTLVVGVSTLATTIFAFAAIGLILLAIQITLQKLPKSDL